MGNRHTDLADLAPGEDMIAIIGGLCRQIEGDRQARLAAREVGAIERVGLGCGRMTGIGAENPRPVGIMLVIATAHLYAPPLLRRNMYRT